MSCTDFNGVTLVMALIDNHNECADPDYHDDHDDCDEDKN